jgi:replicative superfamily II helicase
VAYDILTEVLKHGKQVLVFVHSRKETVNYGKFVQNRAQAMGHQYMYSSVKRDTKSKLNDTELAKLLPYGVGFHHAGMLRQDRNLVERLFLEGDIKVLVATATLAWGVNLPAFAVIIKGTDVFDISRADMQNLNVLDVQ